MGELKIYRVRVKCNNCHFGNTSEESQDIPLKTKVEDYLPNEVCRWCNCRTLVMTGYPKLESKVNA